MRIQVECPGCRGTGICCTIMDGKPPAYPHSCCGDCDRRVVPGTHVPVGFRPIVDGEALIGTGYVAVGFWRWLGVKLGVVRL